MSIETSKTYLRPIDRDGLLKFAAGGKENPERRGTNKVHTVMQGQFRSWSFVVLVDTAGMRKRGKVFETVEKFSVVKTLQSIEDAHLDQRWKRCAPQAFLMAKLLT